MGPRVINAMLGLWLFLSAFLWPHDHFQLINAWVVGIAAVTAALAAVSGLDRGRYLNAALGAWLIISTLLRPMTNLATSWNHLLVGFAMILFGLMTSLRETRGRPVEV
jgi:chromate transport protein ChrA